MLRYVITDQMRLSGDELERQAKLLDHVVDWATAGIDFIQLREKNMGSGALVGLSGKMLAVLRGYNPAPKLLINSRVDVALAVGADGVHLTSTPGELTPVQLCSLYADAGLPTPVVSVSCHSLDEVAAAREAGASLILFGPVFEKRIREQLVSSGTGLDLLRAACAAAAPSPVLALGGVTQVNASECVSVGAAGVAAIRLFQK